jgi:hypothetical protein
MSLFWLVVLFPVWVLLAVAAGVWLLALWAVFLLILDELTETRASAFFMRVSERLVDFGEKTVLLFKKK